MITDEMRQLVRVRAGYACEYCGVTEESTGAELTIDHYHPRAKGGSDELDNLVYCCHRCNEHKATYWPAQATTTPLWNPRTTPAMEHFLELENGYLSPLSETGKQTIKTLRLNRLPLVKYRLRKSKAKRKTALLQRHREIIEFTLLTQRLQELSLQEQQALAKELKVILQELIEGDSS